MQNNELRQLWRMFWRQRHLFVGVLLIVLFFALLLLVFGPRKYEVEARLLYKENTAVSPLVSLYQAGMGGALGGLGGLLGMGANMDNQIALLSGLDLFVEVCKHLPEEDIRALTRSNPLTAPIRVLKRLFIPPAPPRPAYLKAAYRLRRRVRIEPVGASSVIRVVYRDTDRERTRRIVEQIVRVAHRFSERWMADYYSRAVQSLTRQLQETQSRLDSLEQSFVSFQQSTHLIVPDQQFASFAEQFSTLERMRAESETKMAALQAQIRAADTSREQLMRGLLDSSLYEIPQARILWDSLVMLRTEYVSLQIQGMDTAGARMKDLRRRIEHTQAQLSSLLQRSLKARIWGNPAFLLDSLQRVQLASNLLLVGTRAEREALHRLYKKYERMLDTIPPKLARYARYQAKYQYLITLITGLRGQLDQLQALANRPVSAYYTVQTPRIPGDPVSPRPILILAVAVFVGLLGGTGVAIGYELMRNRVEHPDDLADYGAPVLAVMSTSTTSEDLSVLSPVIARMRNWMASRSPSHRSVLIWTGWIPTATFSRWVDGWMSESIRIPEVEAVWLTTPGVSSGQRSDIQTLEPEEVALRVLDASTPSVLVMHPADHPMDPVLRSLLVSGDGVVLVVRRGLSLDVVDKWVSLMHVSKTELLGWIFLQG